jgi:hypothetical protein
MAMKPSGWQRAGGASAIVLALLSAACSPLAPLAPSPPAVRPPGPVPVAPSQSLEGSVARETPPARIGGRLADFGRERVSSEARTIANWVAYSGDNHALPFIIVDKVQAKVLVFDPEARLLGASPALLGLAKGDDSVPGIGERPMAEIRPEERTTPAGRFAAEMGRNASGEDILWVDYDSAVSMHRVRATNPAERRLQRLASRTPSDNRISYGCINLPASFYDRIVKPTFEPHDGIVYVLPETRPAVKVFGAYPVTPLARR